MRRTSRRSSRYRSESLYRWLLYAYPRRLRRRFGEDMVQLFRDRLREARRARNRWARLARLASVWLLSLRDLAVQGMIARGRRLRDLVARPRSRPSAPRSRAGRRRRALDTGILELAGALRSLRRDRGLTAMIVGLLGFGIGANAAIFSVVDAVVIRALPYPDPGRLVQLVTKRGAEIIPGGFVSHPDFEDLRAQSESFEATAIYRYVGSTLTDGAAPQHVDGAAVSPSFFDVLGVMPAAGRFFAAGEAGGGDDDVVVLGHGVWIQRYAGDPAVIGDTIEVGGDQVTIVGVGPPRFSVGFVDRGIERHAIWQPLTDLPANRDQYSYKAIGRLAAGVTLPQAQAELETISARLEAAHPDTNAGIRLAAISLRDWKVGEWQRSLVMMLAAVALVLLIAATNVANLLLARVADRRHEVAVRLALGASAGRLRGQLLAESLALAGAALAVGWALAVTGTRLLAQWGADVIPLGSEVHAGARVLAFAATISVATALFFSALPAHCITRRREIATSLRHSGAGQGSSAGDAALRRRGALVAAQVAISAVLLVVAGLLCRSLWLLGRVDPGMDRGVLTFRLRPLASPAYPNSWLFYDEVDRRLRGLAGVLDVATENYPTMTGREIAVDFHATDRPEPPPGKELHGVLRVVSPGYFHLMGIPLLRGREFLPPDIDAARSVTIVSGTLAARLWPGEDPIGKRIVWSGREQPQEVIGVVADIRHRSLDEAPPPMSYITFSQLPRWNRTVVVKTATDPLALMPAIREAVWGADPDTAIIEVATTGQIVDRTLSASRTRAWLVGMFASAALLMAIVGTYGSISYSVTRRRRELAIRMAVGASRRTVRRLVLRQTLAWLGTGLAPGLLIAAATTRTLQAFLYGVTAWDPLTFLFVPTSITAAGVIASLLPASRATRIDPMTALKNE